MKDKLGNHLEIGDLVVISTQDKVFLGHIKKFNTGGTIIPVNQQQAVVTPAKLEVECILTSEADPRDPSFQNVLKLVDPEKKSNSGETVQ